MACLELIMIKPKAWDCTRSKPGFLY